MTTVLSSVVGAGLVFSEENSPRRGSCLVAPSSVTPKARPLSPFSSLANQSWPLYPSLVPLSYSCPGSLRVPEQNRRKESVNGAVAVLAYVRAA